ncbi:hypothetical protein OE88DRAFT_1227214 [Heliocybe sulcata]|uniref:Uncharacterized protein n=1 Tax=Heliocybe sulcata TaxID=5364 RepID=A0A5C3MKX1_9AGAM|nr:hypothetical protein OE88DRAFT_1227214 [Heliocybe sulcata]
MECSTAVQPSLADLGAQQTISKTDGGQRRNPTANDPLLYCRSLVSLSLFIVRSERHGLTAGKRALRVRYLYLRYLYLMYSTDDLLLDHSSRIDCAMQRRLSLVSNDIVDVGQIEVECKRHHTESLTYLDGLRLYSRIRALDSSPQLSDYST